MCPLTTMQQSAPGSLCASVPRWTYVAQVFDQCPTEQIIAEPSVIL